jgi:hypothetical protein
VRRKGMDGKVAVSLFSLPYVGSTGTTIEVEAAYSHHCARVSEREG